jgi:pyrimidine operon attenuation protein/uracil phosphoribosyltransferase
VFPDIRLLPLCISNMSDTANLTTEQILSSSDIGDRVTRLAREILEAVGDGQMPNFVGIYTRGVTLAKRVAAVIERERGEAPHLGSLDISLYRDDLDNLGTTPVLKHTDIPFDIEGQPVVLFDEVLFTGRTVRAALHELVDFGRPAKIELAVLVDRGNRELPIQPDYTGLKIPTTMEQYVKVRFLENDDKEGVFLLQ